MSLTNKLQRPVDLPVWEWMRFNPYGNVTSPATMCSDYKKYFVGGTPRYAYFFYSSTFFYRYDTWTDCWHGLSNLGGTGGYTCYVFALSYNPAQGYYGQAIGPGPGNNTIQLAAFQGNTLAGYKIYIYAGTGAGQERTIVSVSEPIVHDSGVVQTFSTSDPMYSYDGGTLSADKRWKYNQWRNYQVKYKYTSGSGTSCVRPILYNTTDSIYMSDKSWAALTPWYAPQFSTAPAQGNYYYIESSIATLDSAWTILPDNTSRFVVKSGGLWYMQTNGNTGNYYLYYYDILSDNWYMKGSQTGFLIATPSTSNDYWIESIDETEGGATTNGVCATPLTANLGVISVASAPYNTRTLIDAGQEMCINKYANMMIRLTGGTGAGQTRNIIGNNRTTFIIGRDWDVIPDSTTTYQVLGDSDKLYWQVGKIQSVMAQYSIINDQMAVGRQFDFGVARTFYAKMAPYGISTVTVTNGGTGGAYAVGDILTLTTNGLFTGINGKVKVASLAVGQVATVTLYNAGGGYYPSATAYDTTSGNEGGGNGTGCTITVNTNTIPSQPAIGITAMARTATGLRTVAVNAAGSNYYVDDLVNVTGGSGILRITGVNATGGVTSVAIESPSTGYSVANGVATTNNIVKKSTATGLTINVTAIADTNTATTSTFRHNLMIGDVVMIGGGDTLSTNTSSTYFGGYKVVTGVPSQITFTCSIPTGATVAVNTTGGVVTAINSISNAGAGYGCPGSGGLYYAGTGICAVPTVTNGGTGYAVGDLLMVGTNNAVEGVGNSRAIVKVSTVSSGVVTGITLMSSGNGYAAETLYTTINLGNSPTATVGGSSINGSGCTLTTLSVANGGIGTIYSVTGGGGTGCLLAVSAVTTAGGVSTVYIAAGGSGYSASPQTLTLVPSGAAAVFNAEAISTTLIIDTTKNWQPNELVGKIVQTCLGGTSQTAQQRRITANTSHTISVALAITSPTVGLTKYVIHDAKALGTECTNKSDPRQYGWGVATGGTTGTLIDAPTGLGTVGVAVGGTGYSVNDILTLATGTGGTVKVTAVTSGVVTAISILSQGTGYTAGTTYATTANPAVGTGCTIYVNNTNAKNWIVNQWAGYKVKIVAGTGVNSAPNELLIASNTVTTLTLTSGWTFSAAPDTTTVYAIMDNWGVTVSSGLWTTAAVSAAGSGYSVGDIVWVNGGAAIGCFVKVLTLSGSGVATFAILNPGSGISNTTFTTVCLTGTGSGFIVAAGATQTSTGSLSLLTDSYQNWGTGLPPTYLKQARLICGNNIGSEGAISGAVSSIQLNGSFSGTPDGNNQYVLYGVMSRSSTPVSLIRLSGTTVLEKCRYMISWRGGSTPQIERYDIVQNLWEMPYIPPVLEVYTTGTMFAYDGQDRIYFTINVTGRVMYYDINQNVMVVCGTVPYGMSNAYAGNKMFLMSSTDLMASALKYLYIPRHSGAEMWRTLIYW